MDYDRLRATAERLITGGGNGRTVTISRQVVTARDKVRGRVTTTPLVQTAKMVIASVSSTDRRTKALDDLTIDEAAKVYIPAAGLAWVPEVGDRVELPGDPKAYVVRDMGRARPDGTAVYHVLFVGLAGT